MKPMSETAKTGIMAAIAGGVALLAWATTTRNYSTGPTEATARVNQVLFEKFTEPLAAASLKILQYDTDAEAYKDFEVAKDRKTGVWTIPSHENYPADANKQMSDAANLFVGLKALNVASTKREEHAMFGVLEPDKKKEAEGGEGVGTLVQFRDENGDILADLIIGKPDAQDPKKRFVRVPSEDVIYVAEIEVNPLSTDFKQWIESDLLKLSSNDVEVIGIRNYSLVRTGQGTLGLSPNYDADVAYNVRDGKWEPRKMTVYEGRETKERALEANEELNATKLNDIRSALDNLKIVDVAKKPAGVAADLKGDKLQEETLSALQKRGFYASQSAPGAPYELYATNGDLQVTLKDGVQYLLRFGNGAGATFEPVENESGSEEGNKEVSINRFLLVTTRIDESKFPQPELDRLPETVEELKAMDAAKATQVAPAPATPSVPSGDAASPPAPDQPIGDKPEGEGSGSASEDIPKAESGSEPVREEAPEGDGGRDPQSSTSVPETVSRLVAFQDPAPETPATAPEVATQDPAPTPPSDPEKPTDALTDEEWKERLEAERERITKENQRKIDQRNDRMTVAKKRVAELNARFADWYYIVSDTEFKRLKIELSDLITTKGSNIPPAPTGLPGSVPGLNIPGLSDQ